MEVIGRGHYVLTFESCITSEVRVRLPLSGRRYRSRLTVTRQHSQRFDSSLHPLIQSVHNEEHWGVVMRRMLSDEASAGNNLSTDHVFVLLILLRFKDQL